MNKKPSLDSGQSGKKQFLMKVLDIRVLVELAAVRLHRILPEVYVGLKDGCDIILLQNYE